MLIIKITSDDGKFHPFQSQSHRTSCWIDGYIAVPTELEKTVFECKGYCELTIEDNTLVNITPHKEWIPVKNVKPVSTPQDDTDALMVEHEYRLTMLELGVNE